MNKVITRNESANGGCVVLVCVINKPNKVLTHDKFFKIFSVYGTIQRILIFERGVIWKTFVEFINADQAIKARLSLNGQDFGDDTSLKMNVYASQLERITFQENNSGGVGICQNYTVLRQKIEEKSKVQSNRSFQMNTSQDNFNFQNQKPISQTTSPIYPQYPGFQSQPPSMMQNQINDTNSPFQSSFSNNMFNFTQQQFAQSPYNSPMPTFSPSYPSNFGYQFMNMNQPYYGQQQMNMQYVQQQMMMQQTMQQLMQKVQQIMFFLSQITNEQQMASQFQIDNTQLVNQSQKQIMLLNELNDIQMKMQQTTDQYMKFIQQFNSTTTPDRKNYYQKLQPLQEEVDDSEVPIRYIKTVTDPDNQQENQKDAKSKTKSENDESKKSIEEKDVSDQNDEDQAENDLIFKSFQNQQTDPLSENDVKYILKKMNMDVGKIDNQKEVFKELDNSMQKKQAMTQEQVNELIQQNRLKTNFSDNSPSFIIDQFQNQLRFEDKSKDESQNPAEYVNPLFLKVVRKSKVIYARWFDKNIVTLKMLYNLFSTYGNIDKMIYLKEKSSALVQYETQEYANQAKESLNEVMFYGQQIKIFFSNYEEIYLKNNVIEKGQIVEDAEATEEYFQGCEESNRFRQDCNYSFTPPSEVILVSNLSSQSCQNEVIEELFVKYKELQGIKFVSHPDNKNVCYVKFDSIETSIIALANLHGIELDSRILHLTFSKQKI